MVQSRQVTRFDGGAIPRAIVSAPGSRSRLAEELNNLGATRVLIVTSPTLNATTPFVREATEALRDRYSYTFDGVEPNTPLRSISEAVEALRSHNFDSVVSIGGGSAHDMAKALAVGLPSGRSIADFVSRFEPPSTFISANVEVEPLPVVTIPSTFSAADVVGGGAVTDTERGKKLIFVHSKLTPSAVILDGEIAATTPVRVLAASGMNAVHHCLEAYYSKGAQFVTDAFALSALRALLSALPAIAATAGKDVTAIQAALNATALSGLTYGNSWLGIGHSVCHSLGGRYGLSHGAANAVMVGQSLRFNFEAAKPRLAAAARAVGVSGEADDDKAANALVHAVDALASTLGTPTQLRSIGLPADQFERIAEDVMDDPQTYWNPRQADRDEVARWLQSAW